MLHESGDGHDEQIDKKPEPLGDAMQNSKFKQLFKRLFKAQEQLGASINEHKDQLKIVNNNLIKVFNYKKNPNSETLQRMAEDFKSQHTLIQNSIGQSELCHLKIQQQLLKLRQHQLESNI